MANIKQQKKRIGTAQRQRMANLRYRSTTKTLFNKLQLAVDTGDKDVAGTTHAELVQLLDRSVTRGALHRNTAARKKSRASRMLLQEAKTDTATARKAKKKTTPVRAKAPVKKDEAAKKPAAKKPAAKKAADKAPAKAKAETAEAPEAMEVTPSEEPTPVEAEVTEETAAAEAEVTGDDKADAKD